MTNGTNTAAKVAEEAKVAKEAKKPVCKECGGDKLDIRKSGLIVCKDCNYIDRSNLKD